MKIWALFLIMVWIFVGVEWVNGEEKKILNPGIFLPSEVEGWKWDRKELKYNPRTLFDYINGAAELYLSYGFQNLTLRQYEKSNQPTITLEFYEMASSEDAYGVFTFDRQDEPKGIGQGSEFGGGLLRFWKGKYFVTIYAEGEGLDVESGIIKIGQETANAIPVIGSEPKLVTLIPGKNLGLVDMKVYYLKSHVLLNQRFFIAHQNILNLNRKTEAILAQYLQGKQKTQFILIRYPNLKEAEDAYRSFMNTYLKDAGDKDHSKTEDQKWTMARQRDEFILIVFGAPTIADAEVLLKAAEGKLPGGH